MTAFEATRTMREYGKAPRVRSLLGKVLVVSMRPIELDTLLPSSGDQKNNADQCGKFVGASGVELFQMLKAANSRRVNARLTESFSEVCLSGWISPSTLFITGPSDDIRVIRQSWCRRSLRNPPGFMIKEVGNIEEITMETTQQAQFMSLSASLVEALIDLNKCQIYPNLPLLMNYLKVCHHGVHLPKEEVVSQCLQQLLDERKIFENERGYVARLDDEEGVSMRSQHFDATDDVSVARFDVDVGLVRIGRGSLRKSQAANPSCRLQAGIGNKYKQSSAMNEQTIVKKKEGVCLLSCISAQSSTSSEENDAKDGLPRARPTAIGAVVNHRGPHYATPEVITANGVQHISGASAFSKSAYLERDKRHSATSKRSTPAREDEQQRTCRKSAVSSDGDGSLRPRGIKISNENQQSAQSRSPGEIFARIIVSESEKILREHRDFSRSCRLRRSLPLHTESVKTKELTGPLSGDAKRRHSDESEKGFAGVTFECKVRPGDEQQETCDRLSVADQAAQSGRGSLVGSSRSYKPFFHTDKSDMKIICVL